MLVVANLRMVLSQFKLVREGLFVDGLEVLSQKYLQDEGKCW